MSELGFELMGDRIAVRAVEGVERVTASGLVAPAIRYLHRTGVIVGVGPESPFRVGEEVAWGHDEGTPMTDAAGDEVLVMRSGCVLTRL